MKKKFRENSENENNNKARIHRNENVASVLEDFSFNQYSRNSRVFISHHPLSRWIMRNTLSRTFVSKIIFLLRYNMKKLFSASIWL